MRPRFDQTSGRSLSHRRRVGGKQEDYLTRKGRESFLRGDPPPPEQFGNRGRHNSFRRGYRRAQMEAQKK